MPWSRWPRSRTKKIDAGTRRQIVATARQLWNKTQSDLALAKTTYQRIVTLYKDSVVTSQRRDEVEAMYKAAQAAERAAYEQYQMAVDGAQSEDRASARSLVEAARSTVDEVSSLLVDSRLTAPEDGQIATIFPKRGELVAPGTPIMSLGRDGRCTRGTEHTRGPDAAVQDGRHFSCRCPRHRRQGH